MRGLSARHGKLLRHTAAACLCAMGFLSPVFAQTVPGDAAAQAEAPHFMAVTGQSKLVDAFVERLRLAAIATLANGGLPFAERAELAERLIMPDLRAAAPDLLANWTAIYASDLSAEDMKAIEDFYRTPAGQHFLAVHPQVETSLSIISLTWQTTTLREAVAKHLDALRARGYEQ